METADKIARYQEIERRGLLDRLPQEKQMLWAEYKKRNGPQQQKLSDSQLEERRQQANKMLADAGVDVSGWGVASDALKDFGKGSLSASERLLNGATLGAYDWAGDKLAKAVGQEQLSPKVRRDELEKDSNAIKAINVGLDIVGGIPTGGALFKGVSTGAKAVPYIGKGLQYLAPTATGAVAGGLYSGFENDSLDAAGKGAAIGGLTAGALDLIGRGLSKAWSAAERVKATPRGFENAAATKVGAKTLNRAVRESEKVAEQVYRKTPEALENVNRKAIDKLDDAVRGVDIKGKMSKAKDSYSKFIEANKGKQAFQNRTASYSDLGLDGKLSGSQKKALDRAWKYGVEELKDGEAVGSLKHLDKIKENLNDQISKSMTQSETGVGLKATGQTNSLRELKGYLQEQIDKAGLSGINKQYARAKALEDSFTSGLKFNPNSVKTRNITFKTPEDKNAFAQGLVEQIKMNPETKNIAGKARNLRGILRNVLGDKSDDVFKEIDKLDRAYKNVEKISSNASRKLTVPDPVNGSIGLLREFVESPGSIVGGTADLARKWATAKSAERAAEYLLNPNMAVKLPLREILAPYLSTGAGILTGEELKKGE